MTKITTENLEKTKITTSPPHASCFHINENPSYWKYHCMTKTTDFTETRNLKNAVFDIS